VYDNPSLLQEILNAACDFWTEVGLKLIETGVDAIVIVDDMGANNSTLLSPKILRQMVLPLLNKEVQAIQKRGMPVFLHSCGNVNSILPDIVETGILGLNNIQHAAGMDIRAIKEQYGKRLCLIGNVDSSGVMSFGKPEEVEEAVRECIQAASYGGGHILATDHSFHEGIPLENVYAFIKAGKKYGAKE
jgi:uroporphyrinogen decarboxylase